MALYTNINQVAAELGGVTINSASTPNATTVNDWIADAGKMIEEMTGRIWAETTVTSAGGYEYHDYDGSGRIRLKNKPVISVQSVEYESEGLGAASTAWSTLTEGRTSSANFILYKQEGVLQIHSTANGKVPTAGQQNIRVTYTHGYKSTPRHIKQLATALTAKRYILSVANKTAGEEGGSVSVGTISVSDPNNYVHTHLDRVNKDIEMLSREIANNFKVYQYDSELY